MGVKLNEKGEKISPAAAAAWNQSVHDFGEALHHIYKRSFATRPCCCQYAVWGVSRSPMCSDWVCELRKTGYLRAGRTFGYRLQWTCWGQSLSLIVFIYLFIYFNLFYRMMLLCQECDDNAQTSALYRGSQGWQWNTQLWMFRSSTNPSLSPSPSTHSSFHLSIHQPPFLHPSIPPSFSSPIPPAFAPPLFTPFFSWTIVPSIHPCIHQFLKHHPFIYHYFHPSNTQPFHLSLLFPSLSSFTQPSIHYSSLTPVLNHPSIQTSIWQTLPPSTYTFPSSIAPSIRFHYWSCSPSQRVARFTLGSVRVKVWSSWDEWPLHYRAAQRDKRPAGPTASLEQPPSHCFYFPSTARLVFFH